MEAADPASQLDCNEIGRHRVRSTWKVRPVLLDASEGEHRDWPVVDALSHIRARQVVERCHVFET
jgi:hypothetical protein